MLTIGGTRQMAALACETSDVEEKHYSEKIFGLDFRMPTMPTVNHNIVMGNIFCTFKEYLRQKPGEAFFRGVDVHFDEDNTFVPDVMIVCNKDIIKPDGIYGAPDLVVEVLSPSTARNDKIIKKAVYEKYGVKEYWIADPKGKTLEVYHLKAEGLVLENVYSLYEDYEWKKLAEEKKAAALLPLKVSLYDDFLIDVREIFEQPLIFSEEPL